MSSALVVGGTGLISTGVVQQTFADMRSRGAWRDSTLDTAYQKMIDRALSLGFQLEDA